MNAAEPSVSAVCGCANLFMPHDSAQLRVDALWIWQAGLDAVRSQRLMAEHVRSDGRTLRVDDGSEHSTQIELDRIRRIAVVGTGKAGAGMAAALEKILGAPLMSAKQLIGWVNVPADCVPPSPRLSPAEGEGVGPIHLHAARPAGVNEPTPEGAAGAEEILRIVSSLQPDDLCIALISGGGSALLPAPIEGVSLADKLAVTRFLSAAGADIAELNTVRKQLSRIKGGGLARACGAGRLISLIISDIPGDPLELISSGPTVIDTSTPQNALAILNRFRAREAGVPAAVFEALSRKANQVADRSPFACQVSNFVIGNNAAAVDAAGQEAVRLGYTPAMNCAAKPEGLVEPIGRHLAEMVLFMRTTPGPNCLISGGEGTVKLAPADQRGLGGRNQQTALAALIQLVQTDPRGHGVVILSGGTDGEDGPTDAAGAIVDAAIIEAAKQRGFDPVDFLNRNDAYHFFEPLGGLIKTGPTNTNVCDLRVVLVDRA
jgi:glycerate 2-kinase